MPIAYNHKVVDGKNGCTKKEVTVILRIVNKDRQEGKEE